MRGVTVTVAPTVEPISLADIKTHLRITDTDDDVYLETVRLTAIERVQEELNRFLAPQTVTYTLDAFHRVRRGPLDDFWYTDHPLGYERQAPDIQIPFGPVQGVTSIQYTDASGTLQTLASSEYQLAKATEPARIRPVTSWPVTKPEQYESVVITLTVGYAEGALPRRLAHGLKLIAAHLNENRDMALAFTLHDVEGLGVLLQDFRMTFIR